MDHDTVRVLGIAGSLRRASYNRGALRAAVELAPPGMTIEIADLDGIPPFNQDEEPEMPKVVRELKARIRAADAILFSTPEYNYSIPGVLKNAIDWASRPYGDSAWNGKPAAIMGATIGMGGTIRAQTHLRGCFVFLNMPAVLQPEVVIVDAKNRFDEYGTLVHAPTREVIHGLLASLAELTRTLRRGKVELTTT
jgi:chromate reductase